MNTIPTLEAVIQSKKIGHGPASKKRDIEAELISDSKGVTPDLYECN